MTVTFDLQNIEISDLKRGFQTVKKEKLNSDLLGSSVRSKDVGNRERPDENNNNVSSVSRSPEQTRGSLGTAALMAGLTRRILPALQNRAY